jgi:hypothetical protein
MASIKKTNKAGESLTILTVIGIPTIEELIHAFENFMKHDVTPYLLWDFTDADLSQITQKGMEEIIAVAKSKAHLRKNGRTALVVSQDLSFGLSRMYETLSKIREHPISHFVFRDMDKALTWLKTGA